jgi:S-(hydroxymethyl)mycothiol dehydrogenase
VAERGVVLSEPGSVALEEIEVDAPGPGEVLVRIEATGVCHSDLHVIEENGWGHAYPVLLGHEGAGTVEAIGENVTAVAEGDRVVLAWKTACGDCPACLRGEPRQCTRPPAAPGRLHRHDGADLTPVLRTGTFATRTVVPEAAAIKVPRELPVEQACLIGCAVATGVMSVLETAKVREGARVAVIGCGAVGLSVVQGARLAGAEEIHAIDLSAERAEGARRFGATHTGPAEELDAVFDVVNVPETVEQGLALLGHAGVLVSVGLPRPGSTATVDLTQFFDNRGRIAVSHGGDHLPVEDFPRLAARTLAGELDLAGLVTRTIGLEDVPAAFDDMRAGRGIRSVVNRFGSDQRRVEP